MTAAAELGCEQVHVHLPLGSQRNLDPASFEFAEQQGDADAVHHQQCGGDLRRVHSSRVQFVEQFQRDANRRHRAVRMGAHIREGAPEQPGQRQRVPLVDLLVDRRRLHAEVQQFRGDLVSPGIGGIETEETGVGGQAHVECRGRLQVGGPAALARQFVNHDGRGTCVLVENLLAPRCVTGRVVIDAECALRDRQHYLFHPTETVGRRVIDQNHGIDRAQQLVVQRGIVLLGSHVVALEKAQHVAGGVVVDDAHLLAACEQESGQAQLGSKSIAVGVDVRGEDEALSGIAALAEQHMIGR